MMALLRNEGRAVVKGGVNAVFERVGNALLTVFHEQQRGRYLAEQPYQSWDIGGAW